MEQVKTERVSQRERVLRYFLLTLLAVLAVVMVSLTLNGRFTSPGAGSRASVDADVASVSDE